MSTREYTPKIRIDDIEHTAATWIVMGAHDDANGLLRYFEKYVDLERVDENIALIRRANKDLINA